MMIITTNPHAHGFDPKPTGCRSEGRRGGSPPPACVGVGGLAGLSVLVSSDLTSDSRRSSWTLSSTRGVMGLAGGIGATAEAGVGLAVDIDDGIAAAGDRGLSPLPGGN